MTRNTNTDIFLNHMKWKTITKEFKDMKSLCIDCYAFKFKRPLLEQEQYTLFQYMETLDLTNEQNIVNIAIWLFQHEIPFHMSFQYNKSIPLSFNLSRMTRPKEIFNALEKQKDAVMAHNLMSSPQTEKKKGIIMGKPNTIMHYLCQCADNYKQQNSITLAGHPTDEQKRIILESLDADEYFTPYSIGLPCKQFGSQKDFDHPWYELHASDFEETDANPDTNMTWQQLAEAFASHKECWDEPESNHGIWYL